MPMIHGDTYSEGGSLISGTTRSRDLLPAFFAELLERNPDSALDLERKYPQLVERIQYNKFEYWATYSYDAQACLIELFNRLADCAPPGDYFGAHPNNPTDYGYWPIEDWPIEDWPIED